MSTKDVLSKCRPIPGLSIFTVLVTPQAAQEILKENTRNRMLSVGVVNKYAQEIMNGEWFLSASGIGIDRNGRLMDGQHRLTAIVQTGTTVPMLVVCGLDPSSQEKIDRQKKRSLFDVFHLAGFTDQPKEVQIATFLTAWANRKNWTFGLSYADSDVRKTMDLHRESVNAILGMGSFNGLHRDGFGRSGFLSACVLYHEVDPEKATDFVRKVLTGEMLTIDHPCMKIRKYLKGETYSKGGKTGAGKAREDYRRTVTAINAHYANEKLVMLRETDEFDFRVDGESDLLHQ